jgi:TatA/E family protein of Tat protein translocase
MLSPSDTAVIFLAALLLFGPEQLPRIARQLGEAMRHMQSATHSFMAEMDRAARTGDEPVMTLRPPIAPQSASSAPQTRDVAPESETASDEADRQDT